MKRRRIPSENTHRNVRNNRMNTPIGCLVSKRYRIYKDSNNLVWYQLPWYDGMTSKPWKYIKLVNYDEDGKGSTEY